MAKKNYFGHVFFRAQYRSLVDGGELNISLMMMMILMNDDVVDGKDC